MLQYTRAAAARGSGCSCSTTTPRANTPTARHADCRTSSSGIHTALDEQAKKDGWTVVSMKDDWKQVFPAAQSEVTAIDILLEPDATMLEHSADNNARLLKVFPKGFSLDATHTPHITMLQCFARTADLDKVYAAAGKVLAAANVTAMKLEAFKYY